MSDDPARRAAEPAATGAGQSIRCPFCGSDDTEEMAIFGTQLSTAMRYCRACHTPFERVTRAAAPGADTPGD